MTRRGFTIVGATLLAVVLPMIPPAPAAADAPLVTTTVQTAAGRLATPDDTTDATRSTINEFLPVERSLGECLNSLPRPNCGSSARGGWRNGLVLALVVAGLGFIGWRIVAGARVGRRDAPDADGQVTEASADPR